MNNAFDEIRNAIATAREANSACDTYSSTMARLIINRLRTVDTDALNSLKKELRAYNSQTRKWK